MKEAKAKAIRDEDKMYHMQLQEHLKVLDQKEKEKKDKLQAKVDQEKQQREMQLARINHSRRKEKRENEKQEAEFLKRINSEMEKERLTKEAK